MIHAFMCCWHRLASNKRMNLPSASLPIETGRVDVFFFFPSNLWLILFILFCFPIFMEPLFMQELLHSSYVQKTHSLSVYTELRADLFSLSTWLVWWCTLFFISSLYVVLLVFCFAPKLMELKTFWKFVLALFGFSTIYGVIFELLN